MSGFTRARGSNVSTVISYQFKVYDIANDENRKSGRWATREVIDFIGREVLENAGTEVDAFLVGAEIAGMIERGFDPHRRTGFQRQVL